eukprot:11160744-Lingulodinium_polyedra.AAC.1
MANGNILADPVGLLSEQAEAFSKAWGVQLVGLPPLPGFAVPAPRDPGPLATPQQILEAASTFKAASVANVG